VDLSKHLYPNEILNVSKLVSETIAPSIEIVNRMAPITGQVSEIIKKNSMWTSEIFNEPMLKIISDQNMRITQTIMPSLNNIQVGLDLPLLNIQKQITDSMSDFSKVTQAYRSIISDLPKYDFRIDVVSQEIEQVFNEEPEETTNKLLFKDISEPTNELESKLFDILNENREILNYNAEILKEINDTKTKNVADKQSNKEHSSPAFYKNKMWYWEQTLAAFISLVVTDIVNVSVGTDPHNTVLLALLLRCFLQFLK